MIKGAGRGAGVRQIRYEGRVWVLDHNNPEPLREHAVKVLKMHGVGREDMVFTDSPEASVGDVVVEIWPFELVVGRVRSTRNQSFISGTEFTIELKLDDGGEYAA
ncbi:MAG: hypothetical protein MPJ05_05010 [Nitrosopumilus sp.]|nr:hypothetical protein [Nitrosopumilus sp.]